MTVRDLFGVLRLTEEVPPPRAVPTERTMSARRLVLRTAFADRRRSVPGALLMIGHQGCEALVPVVMGIAVDQAVGPGDLGLLALTLGALAGLYLVLTAAFRAGERATTIAAESVQHRLRTQVTARALDPGGLGGRAWMPGEVLSVATADVSRLSRAVLIGVYPPAEFAAVLVSAIVLLSIWWPLGLAVLVGTPLMILLMDRAGGRLRDRSRREQEQSAHAAATAADLVAGARVLTGLDAAPAATARFSRANDRALAASLRARTSEGLFVGTMGLVTGAFTVGVAVWAGWLTLAGHLTVGQLVTIAAVSQFVIAPMRAFVVNFGVVWSVAAGSAARVLELLHSPYAEEPAAPEPLGETGELTCVLADAEYAAALVRTFPGARADALAAPHEAHFFAGTVSENVGLGRADEETVTAALAAAGCGDILQSLPGGAQARLSGAALTLSGGQRQRLALARALATRAEPLLLWEPTSAVDSVTEASIAEGVREFRQGLTTVVLTRSPALLNVADRVVVVRDGKPQRSGSHAELMAASDRDSYLRGLQ